MRTTKPIRLALACTLAAVTITPAQAQVQELVLHNFAPPSGDKPQARVTLAPDGIYGTAVYGGAANFGVVYKLDTAFHYTVLHSFAGGADGFYPLAGVLRDSAGNLYGTTSYSGDTTDSGVVYKLNTAGDYTVLYNFTGGADGGYPEAGVSRGSTGDLTGTTSLGGAYRSGVLFVLTGVE